MKLRARLTIFSVLLIVVLVAGISAGTIFFLHKLFRDELQQNQHTTLMNFRQVCEEAEEVRDPIIASNYVKTIEKTVPGLAYAVFINERLELMIGENAVFDKIYPFFSRAAERTSSPRVVRVSSGDDILEWSSDVTVNGVIGVVRLGFFQDVIDRTIGEKVNEVQRIVFLVAAVGLVLAIFAAVGMSAQLTEPIARLAEGAKSLGDGNLDTRIEIERKDEFGFLADEFNIMAEKLKELDHLKDEFVSSVSHELRSPLAAIAGYVELLTRKPLEQILPEKRTKAFGIIQESTARLTGFINDILDLAKIKAGRVEIRKTPFQSPKALEEILGLFQPLFEKKRLTGRLEAPGDLPVIPADEEKIKQVITNLVSNAYKFTPEGGTITLRAKDAPDAVIIAVEDTGIGIPKEHVGQLFERFKQVPGTRERFGGPKGTGLGLAISKGIVLGHGGKIWVESELGRGSVFSFSLPKATAVSPVGETSAKIFG
ncbi:MAG: HAMP domain-containing histidine kinase [Elusimicrobia bacterium]|jgi:signal transduction histidine kinase|nr:HAMP domain-containing histidine kinase [Elusimicrobiota bacterium]MBK7208345.1 HAMP domain-containing histidine kinase [Elusimicrobiota bacterium]MBK7545105.1 HAMP domain-containing histidine kinase [Elusimicrobiota bacterium]MBK7574624.1 HAMP domain-containing histidine kinase [Elusimicrobiota bacterium]MBK7688007.1 HAMP domain-containing histidine kinase [Elusimicrobiota bacterium]